MTDRIRRNGLLSSCEPCRRSKMRCDHARPHCARCVRRKVIDQCLYHPAPMAGTKRPRTDEPPITPRSPKQRSTGPTPTATPFSQPNDELNLAGTGMVTMQDSLIPFAGSAEGPSLRKNAHLTRMGIGIAKPQRKFPITPTMITEGVEVLRFLLELNPDHDEFVLERCQSGNNGPSGGVMFETAWKAMHPMLESLRNDPSLEHLTRVSLALFEQTACPFPLPDCAADGAFERAFSGPNLRWETIGMCCTSIGLYGATHRDDSMLHLRGVFKLTRQTAMGLAYDAAVQTRDFCRKADQTNDLTLWMLNSICLFATWNCGDDSTQAWYALGDTASAILALRLHRDITGGKAVPFYMVELRKRLLAYAHEGDKSLATFVGRPPRITGRYCTIDLPLDVPDSALMGSFEDFEASKRNLNENGWNKELKALPVWRARAGLLISMIREEALELLLGPSSPDLAQRARDILVKSAATWDSVPHSKYDLSMWEAPDTKPVMMIVYLKLDTLYTEFLLHKLLICQGEGNRSKTIQTSHEALSLALTLLKKSDTGYSSKLDLEWIMVYYAMPCASVLILELFRQNRQPADQSVTLNRSTLIQDISVLISCCDTIAGSNDPICKQAQKTFSQCLDHILNPPAQPAQATEKGGEYEFAMPEQFPFDPADLGLMELYPQDPDWTTWLESFDLQPIL